MIEDLQRQSYRRWTIALAVVVLATVVAVAGFGPAFTAELNSLFLLGFPVGFYLAAQGAIIFFVVLIFWAAGHQEMLDRKFGASDEH